MTMPVHCYLTSWRRILTPYAKRIYAYWWDISWEQLMGLTPKQIEYMRDELLVRLIVIEERLTVVTIILLILVGLLLGRTFG